MAWKLGVELNPADRTAAVAKFGARRSPQFASIADWLERTRFRVNGKGRLDGRARHCWSSPAWPLSTMLRDAAE